LTFFGKTGFEQAVNAGKPCRIDLHAESPDALISAIISNRGPRHEANAEIGMFPMCQRSLDTGQNDHAGKSQHEAPRAHILLIRKDVKDRASTVFHARSSVRAHEAQ